MAAENRNAEEVADEHDRSVPASIVVTADWERLKAIEQAAEWVINPNGSPYFSRDHALLELEKLLRG